MNSVGKISSFFFAAGLVLSACGSDDEDSSDGDNGAEQSQNTDGPTTTVTTTTTTVASTEGSPTTAAPESTEDAMAEGSETAAPVSTADTELGEILVGENGMTVYGFVPDIAAGDVTCLDACLEAWPPVLVSGQELPEGLDAEIYSVIGGPEGPQLQAGETPLYYFANDTAAGDTTGQGQGENWYVVGADGSLIKE